MLHVLVCTMNGFLGELGKKVEGGTQCGTESEE